MTTLPVLGFVLLCVACFYLGLSYGKVSGHAQGWIDCWFELQAKRQPRDKSGKFVAKDHAPNL